MKRRLVLINAILCLLILSSCQKEEVTPSTSPAIDQLEAEMNSIKKLFPENVLITSYYQVENNDDNNVAESTFERITFDNPLMNKSCFESIPEKVAHAQVIANNECISSTYSVCCKSGVITLCIDYVIHPNVECD